MLYTLYLALPAFLANMSPIFAQKWEILRNLNIPIDHGKKFKNKRIFGENKTYRGFVFGISTGIITSLTQFFVWKTFQAPFPYFETAATAFLFGACSGFGALFGDTIKSFFKRQLSIKPSRPFIPFDQIDYIIGFLIFSSFFIHWQTEQILFLLVFGLIFNPLANITGYFLGMKKSYW